MKNQKYFEEIIQGDFRENHKKITPELFEELSKYKVKKCERISILHNEFNEPVITIRSNYPGLNKMNSSSKIIVKEIALKFEEIYEKKIMYKKYFETPEGPIIFYVVSGDSKILKENSIFIEENHELGRFIDIDIFDVDDDYPTTRMDLFYKPRDCFLCDKPASECENNGYHTELELIEYLENSLRKYLEEKYNKI